MPEPAPESSPDEATTTAAESAQRWGVSRSHARRILTPLTPLGRDTTTGAMRYRLEDAERAFSNRPGKGARTDLQRKETEPDER